MYKEEEALERSSSLKSNDDPLNSSPEVSTSDEADDAVGKLMGGVDDDSDKKKKKATAADDEDDADYEDLHQKYANYMRDLYRLMGGFYLKVAQEFSINPHIPLAYREAFKVFQEECPHLP